MMNFTNYKKKAETHEVSVEEDKNNYELNSYEKSYKVQCIIKYLFLLIMAIIYLFYAINTEGTNKYKLQVDFLPALILFIILEIIFLSVFIRIYTEEIDEKGLYRVGNIALLSLFTVDNYIIASKISSIIEASGKSAFLIFLEAFNRTYSAMSALNPLPFWDNYIGIVFTWIIIIAIIYCISNDMKHLHIYLGRLLLCIIFGTVMGIIAYILSFFILNSVLSSLVNKEVVVAFISGIIVAVSCGISFLFIIKKFIIKKIPQNRFNTSSIGINKFIFPKYSKKEFGVFTFAIILFLYCLSTGIFTKFEGKIGVLFGNSIYDIYEASLPVDAMFKVFILTLIVSLILSFVEGTSSNNQIIEKVGKVVNVLRTKLLHKEKRENMSSKEEQVIPGMSLISNAIIISCVQAMFFGIGWTPKELISGVYQNVNEMESPWLDPILESSIIIILIFAVIIIIVLGLLLYFAANYIIVFGVNYFMWIVGYGIYFNVFGGGKSPIFAMIVCFLINYFLDKLIDIRMISLFKEKFKEVCM